MRKISKKIFILLTSLISLCLFIFNIASPKKIEAGTSWTESCNNPIAGGTCIDMGCADETTYRCSNNFTCTAPSPWCPDRAHASSTNNCATSDNRSCWCSGAGGFSHCAITGTGCTKTGQCTYTCDAGWEDANNNPADGCETPTVPTCSASFDKDSYTLGETMHINFSTPPAVTCNLQLFDPSSNVKDSWSGIGAGVMDYPLKATDPTGTWTTHLWDTGCNVSDTATVLAGVPQPKTCAQLGGTCCPSGQTCIAGKISGASDCSECCSDVANCQSGGEGGESGGSSFFNIINPLVCNSIPECIEKIISFILWIGTAIFPIIIIIGGFLFLISGGDPEKVRTAKRMIFWAVIGLVIVLLARGIISVIKSVIAK
jgi:hypothetical protein